MDLKLNPENIQIRGVFLFLMIALLVGMQTSCSSETKGEADPTYPKGEGFAYVLKPIDTLICPLPPKVSYESFSIKVKEDSQGKPIMFYADFHTHSILKFDLESGEMVDRLFFEKIGPNGIGSLTEFAALNNGDYVIAPNRNFSLIRTNSKAEVKKVYELYGRVKAKIGSEYMHVSNETPLYEFRGDVLYCSYGIPPGKKITPQGYQPFNLLNLESGSSRKLPMSFPAYVHEKTYLMGYQWPTSIVPVDSSFYYCFPTGSDIYRFDLRDSSMVSKQVHSIGLPERIPSSDPSIFPGDDPARLKLGKYLNIIYDPYREIFYRMCWWPMDSKEVSKEERPPSYIIPSSILVFDKNMNKLTEFVIPPNTVFPGQWFVGPKGLYLGNHHPFNEEIKEDQLSFGIYGLEKL